MGIRFIISFIFKRTIWYPGESNADLAEAYRKLLPAMIQDWRKLILSSPTVENPVAVRHAWANNPDAILFNEAGLPASPFRTDKW